MQNTRKSNMAFSIIGGIKEDEGVACGSGDPWSEGKYHFYTFSCFGFFPFQEEFESVYKEVYVPRLWDQGKPDRPCVCLRMNWKKQKKMDAVFLLNHVT